MEYDLAVEQTDKNGYQIYSSITEVREMDDDDGSAERAREFEQQVLEELITRLAKSRKVIDVFQEDRELIVVETRGWRDPLKEIQSVLNGDLLGGVTLDPEFEPFDGDDDGDGGDDDEGALSGVRSVVSRLASIIRR